MKRLLEVILAVVAAGLLAFLYGYWYSSRGVKGPPVPVPPAPAARNTAAREEGEEGYRIALMEEVSSARGKEEKGRENDREEPERVEILGQATVVRRPLDKVILSILLDASRSLGSSEGEASLSEIISGVAAFLGDPPPGLTVGVRTIGGGEEGNCNESRTLVSVAGEEGPGLREVSPKGPRDISRAMYLGAGDMAVHRGRKGLAVVAAGGEECGEWPCETARALYQTHEAIGTWVLRVEAPPPAVEVVEGETAGIEQASEAGGPAVPPAADARSPAPAAEGVAGQTTSSSGVEGDELDCMGRSGGGFMARVASSGELTEGLRRAAAELSRNVVVRLFRYPGQEILGESQPDMTPWKVQVISLAGWSEGLHESAILPARFLLTPGKYRVTAAYGGATASVSELGVASGEEVEVKLTVRAGQLTVLEGKAPWTGGGAECRPSVTVSPVGEPGTVTAERCGLPAQFVLPPGSYEVIVRDEGGETATAQVTVAEGRLAVLRTSPGETPVVGGR